MNIFVLFFHLEMWENDFLAPEKIFSGIEDEIFFRSMIYDFPDASSLSLSLSLSLLSISLSSYSKYDCACVIESVIGLSLCMFFFTLIF